MAEAIEKLARALAEADSASATYEEMAIAAIAAMGVLSPELKAAGAEAFFSPMPTTIHEENERAGSVFRRVIDAALNRKDANG